MIQKLNESWYFIMTDYAQQEIDRFGGDLNKALKGYGLTDKIIVSRQRERAEKAWALLKASEEQRESVGFCVKYYLADAINPATDNEKLLKKMLLK
ncbi:hypothetical protein [Schleiferilactobacillus harbinensis]|uniref:hypothetical protein n=1 Tax=Schleiferilactobacillus harbinensis TaxID=304207 RepID=UPI0021A4C064|nr:hypothetical protein [Schleiferilactobacillus harbinensis]